MDDGKIKYNDLVSPDDSIKNLIEQLTELNKTYSSTLELIKSGAKDIVSQLKSMSTATSGGRAEIDEATAAANRLTRAQKELKFATSDIGKEVAFLKSQVASQNKMSIEQQKRANSLAGSYDLIKIQVKDLTRRYTELSAAERAGEKGERLLNQLLYKKQQLADLDSQMKLHVQTMSAVEKAEQKLAFLRSEEGKRLMELKKLIAEEIASNKTKKASIDEVTQAQERLRAAQSASREYAHELNIQAKEANRIAKLQAQLNLSEAGSYNQLAAQYELNKIKLNAMSAAERQAESTGKKLEAETLALYVQMQKLQEATGNHRLSVGNYAKSWDGLGISVSQVVRELPAAAVSMNTFFLGISNNIPMVVDEIQKLRAENKKLIAEGKPTKSVIGSIASALFSWNTLLVVGLTVLSMHGKAIIDWISDVFKGGKAASTMTELLEAVNEELENGVGSYGKNMVALKRLSEEWKRLTSDKQRLQWIRDNKTEFDQLDVSIRNVSDAENVFVNNTDAMVKAFKLRAKASAAQSAATKKYEEAFLKQQQAEVERKKKPSFGEKVIGSVFLDPGWMPGSAAGEKGKSREELVHEANIKNLEKESRVAMEDADALFELSEANTKLAEEELKRAGIESKHKYKKDRTRTPRQRDLTDQIWRNDLSIRKKYELSLSELQRDEFEKRRIEATDQANQTIREMQEKFRKNQVFLTNPDNKFKPLSPEQIAQIEQQQKEIGAIIENTRRKLNIDLTNLEYEAEIDRNKKLRQVMDWRLEDIEKDLEKEKNLRLKQLEDQESLYTTKGVSEEGGEIVVTGSMSPEERAKFQRERERITAEYDAIIYNMKADNIEAQLELVKKGSQEELDILIRQNEIARKLAIAENKLKPVEERQDESTINKQFDKRKNIITGQTTLTNFDEAQAAAEAEFNIVKRSENAITIFKLKAEQDRWKEMVRLAESGSLDWSDAQLKEAKATIEKLQREIDEAGDFMNLVSDKGVGGALLTKLGFNDDQIAALEDATNIVINNIKAIADAEVEAAEAAVEAATKRTEAAQNAYDAEVEARANGFANNVATAKKELLQEKKNQAEKEKALEAAKKRQEAINTVIQTSSLITASANLWSSFSSVPIIGPALALAAIAAMWTSFAVAKVKAAQVTKSSSQEYGEGGLEILEGGSHASGNDIDLQTTNRKGKNMRAEGGEALAIINKRSTRRYRKVLPDIVNSLNKGIFEEKYLRAFSGFEHVSIVANNSPINLSKIEDDVRSIRKQSEIKYHVLPNGTIIIQRKNVRRIIKN